jgi:hypothetical protein
MSKSILMSMLAVGLISSAVQAEDVVLDPVSAIHSLGDVFSVNVLGKNFATALDAGGLNLAFDPSVLSVATGAKLPSGITSSVQFDSVWNPTFAPTSALGSLNNAMFFANNAPAGDFSIYTVWFEASGVGKSTLTLSESALNPFAGAGGALAVNFGSSQVSVVPLPPTVWLFVSGLILLVAQRKSRLHNAR